MGRAEVGTPKYLANKMKAKGLQKLRWYCQMCQKQCRDENGFKCHTMSESHQRQLLLFADNARKYMDEFSYEFSKGYLEILRRQFGTKRVSANKVYQEYISDKNHLHMNATRWLSLTGFVKWLGRTGKCIVDETEKGWFITYIDRDPDTIAREQRKQKKIKMDKDDEEKMMEFITKQVEMGQAGSSSSSTEPQFTEFVRQNEEDKLKLNLALPAAKPAAIPVTNTLESLASKARKDSAPKPIPRKTKPSTALDEIMAAEERLKEKRNRKDFWIAEGIVVKVLNKDLGEKFYKKKAVVRKVEDKYTAIVKMVEGGQKVKLDQAHLETVIPAVGKKVKVVNGAYRDSIAVLTKLNERDFSVDLEISSGLLKGRQVTGVRYEDISKLHEENL